MTAKQLLAAALELPEDERADLAGQILESLEGFAGMAPEVRDAWVTEVNDRLRAYREGRSQPVPAAEAIDRIRGRLRQLHEG